MTASNLSLTIKGSNIKTGLRSVSTGNFTLPSVSEEGDASMLIALRQLHTLGFSSVKTDSHDVTIVIVTMFKSHTRWRDACSLSHRYVNVMR